MANEKRELVDLIVGELSLVDFPANLEEFAIVKSLNQEDNVTTPKKGAEAEVKVETTEVEKAEEVKTEATEEATEETAETEVEKAEEEATEEVVDKSESMELAEIISKAISDAVAKSNSEMIETLKSLLSPKTEEVSKEEEKAEEVVTKEEEKAQEEPVEKSLADKLDTLIKVLTPKEEVQKAEEKTEKEEVDVAKALEALEARLTEIETTQMPSTSVEASNDTDTEANVEKSFWAGVLR